MWEKKVRSLAHGVCGIQARRLPSVNLTFTESNCRLPTSSPPSRERERDPGISQRSLSLSFITTYYSYTLFSLSLSPLLIPGLLNALSLLLPLIHCSLSLSLSSFDPGISQYSRLQRDSRSRREMIPDSRERIGRVSNRGSPRAADCWWGHHRPIAQGYARYRHSIRVFFHVSARVREEIS